MPESGHHSRGDQCSDDPTFCSSNYNPGHSTNNNPGYSSNNNGTNNCRKYNSNVNTGGGNFSNIITNTLDDIGACDTSPRVPTEQPRPAVR